VRVIFFSRVVGLLKVGNGVDITATRALLKLDKKSKNKEGEGSRGEEGERGRGERKGGSEEKAEKREKGEKKRKG